jgi:hypothetical protein
LKQEINKATITCDDIHNKAYHMQKYKKTTVAIFLLSKCINISCPTIRYGENVTSNLLRKAQKWNNDKFLSR